MKHYILSLFTLITFSATSQSVKYLPDGTPVVVESAPFDSLAKVVQRISYWEENLAIHSTEASKARVALRALREEAIRLGGFQEQLDERLVSSIQSLTKYNDKNIEMQVRGDRIRCVEITGYTDKYEQREVYEANQSTGGVDTIIVTDTIPDPIYENLGRVRMKSAYSFDFDGSTYYRIETVNGRIWAKEDDKEVFFQ